LYLLIASSKHRPQRRRSRQHCALSIIVQRYEKQRPIFAWQGLEVRKLGRGTTGVFQCHTQRMLCVRKVTVRLPTIEGAAGCLCMTTPYNLVEGCPLLSAISCTFTPRSSAMPLALWHVGTMRTADTCIDRPIRLGSSCQTGTHALLQPTSIYTGPWPHLDPFLGKSARINAQRSSKPTSIGTIATTELSPSRGNLGCRGWSSR
jgi:hypothetical protein